MATTANNVLLRQDNGLPLYGKVEPTMVRPAIESLLNKLDTSFTEFEKKLSEDKQTPTWEGLVDNLEIMRNSLTKAWATVSHLNMVKNSDALRVEYEAMEPKVVEISTRIGQSKAVYDAFTRLSQREDLDGAQRRVVELALLGARQSGVGLEGEEKKRFNEIEVELSSLSTKFGNNVLDATKDFQEVVKDKEVVAGLPDGVLALMADRARTKGHEGATAENGPWILTLDHASFGPFMEYSECRPMREKLYRAYTTRASSLEPGCKFNNEDNIQKILELRKAKAQLLGYESYAAFSVARKMAQKVENVNNLLDELQVATLPAAKKEFEVLKAYAASRGHKGEFHQWDVAYWSVKQKKEIYGVDGEALRPYFPLPTVLNGLFSLASRLFNVNITEIDVPEGVAWHPDVKMFKILDQSTHKQIASFFLDPYSRPAEKNGGAWMNVCIQRSKAMAPEGQEVSLPVAHLVCNQSPPVDGKPSLMSFREVETVFHEFGHGLQHMLTNVTYGDVAGLSGIEWDAVELPSQFMENWCYEKPTMDEISGHYETGEKLPEDIFKKILGARTYNAGMDMLRQIQFAVIDFSLHTHFEAGDNAFERFQEISPKVTVIPPLPTDRFLCSFSHIFAGGYAAGYYSYKWAQVLSEDAFSAFEEAGP
eukprot:Ihof_evm10s119 gene=Ihof_evmTU10s119